MDDNDEEKIEVPKRDNNGFIEEPMVSPSEMEHPKRRLKRGTIPKLLLSFILFAAGIYLIIISLKYDEETVEKPEENITNETPAPIETVTVILDANDTVYLTGSNETVTDKQLLILKGDNTFVYSNNIESVFSPIIGTYKINNGTLTLEEKVKYGSDNCFFKENWKDTFTGKIENDTINIKIKDEDLVFNVGELPANVNYDPKWYVVNPTNGGKPDETKDEEWIDCDIIEN